MGIIVSSKVGRLGINYIPLDFGCDIIPYGGVADQQVYNSRDGGFTPDYATLTPLTLFPKCMANNSQREVNKDYVNDDLTNIQWFELVYNSSTKKYVRGSAITTGTSYQVVNESADGLIKGMLIVKKNSSINTPIRLEFTADYVDERTGKVINFIAQKNIYCDSTERPAPTLHVSPRVYSWNPLKDGDNITFEALLSDGKNDVTNSKNTKYLWYRKTNITDKGYTLVAITGSADTDIDVVSLSTKSATVDGKAATVYGNKLTINCNFIGEAEYYYCRAVYRSDGLKSSTAADGVDPYMELAILRSMPSYDVDWACAGDTLDEAVSYINPVATVSFDKQEVANPEEFFRLTWYVSKDGGTNWTVMGYGRNPQIPFTDGMLLKVTAEDFGAYKLLVDDSGNKLVDDSGALLYDR